LKTQKAIRSAAHHAGCSQHYKVECLRSIANGHRRSSASCQCKRTGRELC
jgi:hypothetical protein